METIARGEYECFSYVIKRIDIECVEVRVYEFGYRFGDWCCADLDEALESWHGFLADNLN